MSLILDALKRAERERKLEKAPDLSAIYQEDQPERRNYRKWFWVGSALLCIVGVFLFLVWPKSPGETEVTAKSSKVIQAVSKATKPSPVKDAGVPQQKPVKTAKESVPPPSVPSAEKNEPQKQAPAPEEAAPTPQKEPPQQPVVVRKSPRRLPDKVFTAALKPEKTDIDTEPFPESDKATDFSEKTEQPYNGPDKTGNNDVLPSFNDLPEEILSVSGPLEINVHVYSDKPSERRVFINMKGYREGDAIEETGFKVAKITFDGVVIDYGRGKALLKVSSK